MTLFRSGIIADVISENVVISLGLNPMWPVPLYRDLGIQADMHKGKMMQTHREKMASGDWSVANGEEKMANGEDGSDAITAKEHLVPPQLEESRKAPSPMVSEKAWPCQHLD